MQYIMLYHIFDLNLLGFLRFVNITQKRNGTFVPESLDLGRLCGLVVRVPGYLVLVNLETGSYITLPYLAKRI
jgi:hypothetical protein